MSEKDINLHVVATFVWIKKGDTYLLAKRASDDPQAGGLWALPGGKVDMDQGDGIIEATLVREVMEETGLSIENFVFLTSQGFVRVSGHHVVSLIFRADWVSGEAQALEGQEEVRWMSLQEIEQLIESDSRLSFLRASLIRLKEC